MAWLLEGIFLAMTRTWKRMYTEDAPKLLAFDYERGPDWVDRILAGIGPLPKLVNDGAGARGQTQFTL